MSKRRIALIALGIAVAVIVVVGMRPRELYTEIEIAASPSRVWSILITVDKWGEWNPHIPEVDGEPREGEHLRVRVDEGDGKGMTFKSTVTRVVPEEEFRWLGRLFVPGIFDGEHIFEIKPSGDGVRFVQRENFRGILVPFFWKKLETETKHGFESMNVALKERAEAS